MKLRAIKPLTLYGDLKTFVSIEVVNLLNDWQQVLRKLTFDDNMDAFVVRDFTIAAGQQEFIRNRLGTIPTGFIILKNSSGHVITEGDSSHEWTEESLYIWNRSGSGSTRITIVFVR